MDLGGVEGARSKVAKSKDVNFRIGMLPGSSPGEQTLSPRISLEGVARWRNVGLENIKAIRLRLYRT